MWQGIRGPTDMVGPTLLDMEMAGAGIDSHASILFIFFWDVLAPFFQFLLVFKTHSKTLG